jgi:predicted flap endonuclease-1-like 5' DNA nuclease
MIQMCFFESLSQGHYGCYLGHKGAVFQGIESNSDFILIFECDCVIDVPFTETSGAVKKTVKKASTKVAKSKVTTKVEDNITLIAGINKNIQTVLNKDGIITFKDLGKCTMKKLLMIIENAGLTDKANFYTTWTKQAKLAAAEKWEEFESLKK